MTSPFTTWFTSQFGNPVFRTPEEAQKAREFLHSVRQRLAALEREMSAHDLYEEHKRAALYAWQARNT